MSFVRRSVVGSSLLGLTTTGSEGLVERISSFQISVQLIRRERESDSALFGSTTALPAPGGPGADSIAWESDNSKVAIAVQERIDQQLPSLYHQSGLVGNFTGQPFQNRTWEDLCGVDQLYSDIRHYTGPIFELWQAILCPSCDQPAQEWDSSSTFILLTQPLRTSFSDNPGGPRVRTSHLTVQKDLWRPVVAAVIRRQFTINGTSCDRSVLLVLDISGLYLVNVPCQCASDVRN